MALFGYVFEPADLVILATLLLLEGVLSFDNAAVLAAMVRKLPLEQRKKALLYGLAGAYAFRIIAILGVAWIIRFPVLKAIGGAYLVYLAIHHLFFTTAHSEHAEEGLLKRFGISGFWGIVIAVELADIAFALDQVLVAVALTPKLFLIIVASLVAILILRVSAAYMSRIMDWFPALEKLAYVAVGIVGLKLVVVEAVHYFSGNDHFEVPTWISTSITLSLLVLPPLGKFIYDRYKKSGATAR